MLVGRRRLRLALRLWWPTKDDSTFYPSESRPFCSGLDRAWHTLGFGRLKKEREAPFPVSFIGKFPLLASFYFFVGFRGDGGKILPSFSVATATCKNAGGGRRMLPRSRLFFDLSRNRLPRSPTNSKNKT